MTELADIARLALLEEGTSWLLWAALASLFVTTRRRPALVTLLLFGGLWLWQFGMLAAQYDATVAAQTLAGTLSALPADAPWLALRYAAMYAVVVALWRTRLLLHGRRTVTQAEPRAA